LVAHNKPITGHTGSDQTETLPLSKRHGAERCLVAVFRKKAQIPGAPNTWRAQRYDAVLPYLEHSSSGHQLEEEEEQQQQLQIKQIVSREGWMVVVVATIVRFSSL
jgi:hypothetical protein